MNDNEIRFVYVRTNRRPTTIAYLFDDENKQIIYNSAACSEKDQFVKSVGRLKATKRLTLGVKRANGTIPYEVVADESGHPKYNLIAAELHARHADAEDFSEED